MGLTRRNLDQKKTTLAVVEAAAAVGGRVLLQAERENAVQEYFLSRESDYGLASR